VRGPARIDGEEIVLDGGSAEEYAVSDPEDGVALLLDLGNLGNLGKFVGVDKPGARMDDAIQVMDTGRALDFVERHGLLWHGPKQVRRDEVRESLKDWFWAGLYFSFSAMMYLTLRRSLEGGTAKPARDYLWTLRDAEFFKLIKWPDSDDELLEFVSVQLAESITRGMDTCTPTVSAACGLLEDGKKVGGAGDFRFGNESDTLEGAAYYQLALLVSRKERVEECGVCGELFVPKDPRQMEHKTCGNRKRQRESRKRRKSG
jgi:hypothetical protein